MNIRNILHSVLVMRAGNDLMEFMKYSDVKPWKAMIGPFMQVDRYFPLETNFNRFNLDAIFHFILSRYSWFSQLST